MIKAVLLVLALNLPSWVDGEDQIIFSSGKRGGDPIVTINGEVVLRHGQGPGKIEPGRCHYDPLSRTVWISNGLVGYTIELENRIPKRFKESRYSSQGGVWGDYIIMFHHDFLKNKNLGGRLMLESRTDGKPILLAKQEARHSNRPDLTFFVFTKKALVIMDNFIRKIGYLPLVDGSIITTQNAELKALTPLHLKWFPMAPPLLEAQYYWKREKLQKNRFLFGGAEIAKDLLVLRDSQNDAYLYDLGNPSSFYLGTFGLEHMIVGGKSGKLIVRDVANDALKTIDPLALARIKPMDQDNVSDNERKR
jgi:hypothetical protein